MTTRIHTPALSFLLILGLGACADGGSDPEGLRSTPAAVTPDEASEPKAGPSSVARGGEAARAVAQWRPWMESEVERLQHERPEHFDAVMGLEARATRAGFPRLTGPLVRDPDTAPILLHRLLSSDESVEVRAAIVEALPHTTGDYSAALADLMALETEPRVRELIATSLYRAQPPYALDGLSQGLDDADVRVRAEALRSLGRRADGDQLATEIAAALTDPDETVVKEAARALGNLQVASAKEALAAQLSHDSAAVRLHSLRALSRIDTAYARALPQLQSLRSDPDPKVARVAETIASEG